MKADATATHRDGKNQNVKQGDKQKKYLFINLDYFYAQQSQHKFCLGIR